jgi:hypothetical protein
MNTHSSPKRSIDGLTANSEFALAILSIAIPGAHSDHKSLAFGLNPQAIIVAKSTTSLLLSLREKRSS